MWTQTLELLLACIMLSACGTVGHGPTQRIPVTSVPPGATVAVNAERHNAVTPTTVQVSRAREATISLSKAGYKTEVIVLKREMSPEGFAGLIFPPAALVDAATGSQFRLVPDEVSITLTPQ